MNKNPSSYLAEWLRPYLYIGPVARITAAPYRVYCWHMRQTLRDALQLSGIPVVIASLCCLSPLILVLVGVSTVSFASSLADTFYGDYKWWFRSAGLVALLGALYVYLTRQKGICTIDEAKRRRNEIINYLALTLIVGVLGYLFFLYVVVHYLGAWLGLWAA